MRAALLHSRHRIVFPTAMLSLALESSSRLRIGLCPRNLSVLPITPWTCREIPTVPVYKNCEHMHTVVELLM